MLFNSLAFLLFCLAVYPLYWVLKLRWQNILLTAASLFFYGFWDLRFLSLLLVTITLDYFCGRQIKASRSPIRKRFFLYLSLASNLGMLGFFKYFDFFSASTARLWTLLGFRVEPYLLHIILPVGISFYVFQSISYVIDIYRGNTQPAKSLMNFALFVSFFPQLVAGPIERSGHLLPQLESPRRITRRQLEEGAWLVLWGLYKKAYMADHLSRLVLPVFSSREPTNGAEILLALYAFAFQIYGDFSGYSDMARGLAKLMGVELMINFGMPYRTRSPREFWRHWHISFSQWLRDYVYIPLGGNRKGEGKTYRNLMLAMLAGGLWHGAGWTYLAWGTYHGILLACEHAWHSHKKPGTKEFLSSLPLARALKTAVFFHLICLGWLFFRAESISQCGIFLKTIFLNFGSPSLHSLFYFFYAVWFVLLIAWRAEPFEGGLVIFRWPWWARGLVYFLVFYSLVIFGAFDGQQFIYFQF